MEQNAAERLRDTTDWPDDDGPVTNTELWVLREARQVPHGELIVCKRDGEIKRIEKHESKLAPEGRG